MSPKRYFTAYFYYNGLNINLGISLCLNQPNIEIHIPFGFFKIGWVRGFMKAYKTEHDKKGFGYRYDMIVSNKKAIVRAVYLKDGDKIQADFI